MTAFTTDELTATIQELRTVFPDWRMGQLIANLLLAAGLDSEGALWDVEDEQLLIAAKRLLERNRIREEVAV